MMNWWVDRGVDGFRMDVINMISKPPTLRDGDPLPGQKYADSEKFFVNGPRLEEFLAEMNQRVGLSTRNLLTVGEMPGSTIELARRVTDPGRRELNMVFTFEHVRLDRMPEGSKWDLKDLYLPELKQNLADWQVGLAGVGWNSLYWDNHDQPRAVSRFGDDSPEHRVKSAKTLATVQHMHQGTPYVYQGEELGMTNTYFADIGQYRDLESVNYHSDALSLGMEVEVVLKSLSVKSRDNARTPMQWDDTPHAGFTAGIPWLPVNPNYVTINAAAAVADPDSVFHHFRRLIALRRELPILIDGRFELLLPKHEQIWALTRTLEGQVLLMVANCSSAPVTVPDGALPDVSGAEVLLATHPGAVSNPGGTLPEPPGAGSLELAPWESRVYLRR
jgi:oligo-1,6-glucosidase